MAPPGKVKLMVKDEMNLHKRPKVNAAQLNGSTQRFEPRSLDFSSDRDIEFLIEGNTNKLIDFKQSTMTITFSLEKKNPDHTFQVNPDDKSDNANEMVTPIDGFFHTMWRSIIMKWNDEFVSKSRTEQAYRAYIDLLTSVGEDELTAARDNILFCRNEGTEDQPNPYVARNGGGMVRWSRTSGKKKVKLSGPLMIDMWKTKKLLIGGVDIHIILQPASDKFRFQLTKGDTLGSEFVMKIEDCYLDLFYYDMLPAALRAQERSLSRSPFLYPYTRTEIDVQQLRQGIRERRIPDLYARQIPNRLLVMMVKQNAYAGDYSLNPFNFVHNKIATAAFHIDNLTIPAQGYSFEDVENDKGCIHEAVNALRQYGGKKNLGIDLDNFTDGKFILVFNTDPTVPRDLEYWGLPKSGNTKLHLTFTEALDAEYELILYATFPVVTTIDKNRVVTAK